MIRFVKLNLKKKNVSVNETNLTWGQITLYVCELKHAFVSHRKFHTIEVIYKQF